MEKSKLEGFDEKWLKGIKYHDAEKKIIDKDGRKVTQSIPFERPVTVKDVMSWREAGDSVVIVIADGMKYTVKK